MTLPTPQQSIEDTGTPALETTTMLDLDLGTGKAAWRLVSQPLTSKLKIGPAPVTVPSQATYWPVPLEGSQWVGDGNGTAGCSDTPYVYELTFTLDAGFSTVSGTMNVRADDSATIYLNGTNIGAMAPGSWLAGSDPLVIDLASWEKLLKPGTNTLRVAVPNPVIPGDFVNNPTGLLVWGTLTVKGQPAKRGGKIILYCNDMTLSEIGFERDSSSATAFAKNIASWFTGGAPGNFLVYSRDNQDGRNGLTGATLATTMTGAGHKWTVSTNVDFTASALAAYDAVFVLETPADTDVLTTYVAHGGCVYVGCVGTYFFDDPTGWNPFLKAYGLQLSAGYKLCDDVPFDNPSSHPLIEGVSKLYIDGPANASVVDPKNSSTQLLSSYKGYGLLAIYEAPSPSKS